MSGPERGKVAIEIGAENWAQELLPELPAEKAAQLGPDRDILFEGLVEFIRRERPEGVDVSTASSEDGVAADAALLLPGARIHIRVTPEVRPTLLDAVKVAAAYILFGGNPAAGGVVLSIDLAYRIFDKATKLDEDELTIVTTLIDLRRGGGSSPTTAELQAALPDLGELERRLEELTEKEVVARDADGWIVNF